MAISEDWKIVQIMPAVGWVALYQGDQGGFNEDPLAAWALIDDMGRTFVTGLIAVSGEPALNFAEEDENFVAFKFRGEAAIISATQERRST